LVSLSEGRIQIDDVLNNMPRKIFETNREEVTKDWRKLRN